MKSGEVWTLWLVGAGIGLVFGVFAAVGQLISSRKKKGYKESDTDK